MRIWIDRILEVDGVACLGAAYKTGTKFFALKINVVDEKNQLDAQNMEAALEVGHANAQGVAENLRLQHRSDALAEVRAGSSMV